MPNTGYLESPHFHAKSRKRQTQAETNNARLNSRSASYDELTVVLQPFLGLPCVNLHNSLQRRDSGLKVIVSVFYETKTNSVLVAQKIKKISRSHAHLWPYGRSIIVSGNR